MQDQKKGKRKLHIAAEKISYSKESNDQQDQKRIYFITLSSHSEDELLVVVPSPFRACSLQFSNDWQIS